MSEYKYQAFNVLNSEEFTVSLLVWPVPLVTLIALGIRCYREERLREALPLLVAQLNSAITWGCLAAAQVG